MSTDLRLLWDFKDWLLKEHSLHVSDRLVDEFLAQRRTEDTEQAQPEVKPEVKP